jgi:hypothetical protein
MVQLILVHGRGQEFNVPVSVQRPLEEALRWGLERVGSEVFKDIPLTLAYYGDYWRPDSAAFEVMTPATPTELQRQVTEDMLNAASEPSYALERLELIDWSRLNRLATTVDRYLHLGDRVVQFFLEDVESYFANDRLRDLAIDRVAEAVNEANDEIVLLGHSLGSVVAYDFVRNRPGASLRGFITLGAPLGLPTVLRRIETPQFPERATRWANFFESRDFVTGGVRLSEYYPSADGREVEDYVIEGRAPGLKELTASHDGTVYLSSMKLATVLDEMIMA